MCRPGGPERRRRPAARQQVSFPEHHPGGCPGPPWPAPGCHCPLPEAPSSYSWRCAYFTASAAVASCGRNVSRDHGRLRGDEAEMDRVSVLSESATRAPFLMAGIWPRSGSAVMASVVEASGTQVTKMSDFSSLAFSADHGM